MSFFGRLFGTEKAIGKIVDSVSSGLDALVYTDQEREHDSLKERSEARSMIVEWVKASQGQNLARRVIALSVTGVWLLQYLLSQALLVCAVWSEDKEALREASGLLIKGVAEMDGAVMLILAFYFAAPHMGRLVAGLKKNG